MEIQIEEKDKGRFLAAIFTTVIVIGVMLAMVPAFMEKVEESRLKENHCLDEEIYYYRMTGWFIFSSRIETQEKNADAYDYRCLRWEEDPSFGRVMLGQELIHDKGDVIKQESEVVA